MSVVGRVVTIPTKGTGAPEQTISWERSHEQIRACADMFEHRVGGQGQRPARERTGL